jgi:subtilase family serine protease
MRTALQIAALSCALAMSSMGVAQAAPTTVHACAVTHQPGVMSCMALRRALSGSADRSGTPSGYSPDDLRSAYNVPDGGNGVTIAITDAYNDPHAESDLKIYRSQYGLPACTTANGCFRQVNQKGAASPLPSNDSSWSGEISLDLDMVSAICPACHILLIEALSNQDDDLFTAISRAMMGAKFVSNSWGGDEESNQTTLDKQLDHPGVAITVSTGDNGYGTEYPATSRFVTAVGGTTLRRSSNVRGWSETVWNGSGSGCSAHDAKPVWQIVSTACSRRAVSDVSAVADPNTGVAVYQTFGGNGWSVYGGTSTAAPIVAAMFALAGPPAPVTTRPPTRTRTLPTSTTSHPGTTAVAVRDSARRSPDGTAQPDWVRPTAPPPSPPRVRARPPT